jgi:integrase
LLLSRLPRVGEIETQVCRVEGEWKERRTAAQEQAKGEGVMIYKRGGWHWTDFTENGRRYRRPLRTKNWQEARTEERKIIERARAGKLADSAAPKRLFEAAQCYLDDKAVRCSRRTHELETERLSMVRKSFGDARIAGITPSAIQRYQHARKKNGTANRTINMDVGALSRVLKHFGLWRPIEERVKQLPETASQIGHALTYEEQHKLLEVASGNPDWEPVYLAAVLAANTSLRPVEVKHLQWRNVDLIEGLIRVTRSKNQSSHRVIPLNQSARTALATMRSRAEIMGFTHSEHYVWFARQWQRFEPTRPVKKWDTAWRNMRHRAGLPKLRFHDLRHTIITEMAEAGVPDHVMESISGHLSRRMLEHYPHVRIEAKREALDALDARRAVKFEEISSKLRPQ